MFVRALAIVGIALLIGLIDSYMRPIQLSLEGNPNDPGRTAAEEQTEQRVIEGLTEEDKKNPNASLIKRGGRFVSIDEAKKLYDAGVQFFDARVDEEFKEGHVKGAVMLDPTDAKVVASKRKPEFLNKYDPRYPIVVYCNGGGCESSQLVAIRLKQFGFIQVKVFEEGYPAWRDKKFPIETN
jgi:rhodanese-related sulfurtransferase